MAYIMNKIPILCRPVFHKNIIFGPINKNVLVKSYEHLTNKTNPWAEKKYRLKDNISDDYRLVYREQLGVNTITVAAYHIGWISLISSIFIIGYMIYEKPPLKKETEIIGSKGILRPLTTLQRVFMLFTSFAVSIILIVGSRTIPFRIYHNPTEKIYKAVFVSRVFGKMQTETFGEGTVVPVFSRKFLGDILFNINGRIVILDKECFPVPYVREQMIRKTE